MGTLRSNKLSLASVSVLFLVLVSSVAAAAEDPPLGSGRRTSEDAAAELQSVESKMNASVLRIAKLISEQCEWCKLDGDGYRDLAKNVSINQDAWRTYANAECQLLFKLEGPGWNAWSTARSVQCQVGQARSRLRQLRNAERCMVTRNNGKKSYWFQECLRQLAPLSIQ